MKIFLWFLLSLSTINGRHFNGGTISWAPIDPYTNSSSIAITITQTYSWVFPVIKCANNVPISTAGRSGENDNLTCTVDCSTDGGYSTKPINILTDCVSSSASLGMMSSQRSTNISLTANAYFSVAYQGAAWRSLNYPPVTGLDWSILSIIDLRKRSDGFINTPPVAAIISPQYVIVNKTTQIQIPVSDANQGDDVRCRWAIYRTGYRRRRQSDEYATADGVSPIIRSYTKELMQMKFDHMREKRAIKECSNNDCLTECKKECRCNCTTCLNTDCTEGGLKTECQQDPCPTKATTRTTTTTTTRTTTTTTTRTTTTTTSTTTTTTTTTRTTATTTSATTATTESETPGTKRSTSTFPIRQAIDECGGICHPTSTPNTTTLSSNCTLSFTGTVAGAWYALAIQVEDFINSTSNEPLSSIPVQFLIYVLPTPKCSTPPRIEYTVGCLEAQIGVPKSFQAVAINTCDPDDSRITDIIASTNLAGVTASNLTRALDESYASITYTWTPQITQSGIQQFCTTAFTSERVQSNEYCINFMVSSNVACTTTTTSTTTSRTTSSSSSTSRTTTTTSITTKTTSTTTSSSSSTSTTTTTTSITTTTTSTVTSSSSTASTTTTTTSTATTSSSTTSTTTTTVTTAATAAKTNVNTGKGISWGLLAGIISAALPLTLFTCCCLYRLLCIPSAKRRQDEEEDERWAYRSLTSRSESLVQNSTPTLNENVQTEGSGELDKRLSQKTSSDDVCSLTNDGGSILVEMYSNTNGKRTDGAQTRPSEQSFEMRNLQSQPLTSETGGTNVLLNRRATLFASSVNKTPPSQMNRSSVVPTVRDSSGLSASEFNAESGQSGSSVDWTRLYLFGRKQNTGMPRLSRPS